MCAPSTAREGVTRMSEAALTEVRGWRELHAALRARAESLDVSRETLDHLTGLQNGYCAKILAPKPIRNLGRISFDAMLAVLGLKLIVTEDQAMEKIRPRLVQRKRHTRRIKD
jgi:hypothetical protein